MRIFDLDASFQIFDDLAEEHFNKTNIQISETELAQAVSTSFSRVIGWGAAASPCKSMRLCAEVRDGRHLLHAQRFLLKFVSWKLVPCMAVQPASELF